MLPQFQRSPLKTSYPNPEPETHIKGNPVDPKTSSNNHKLKTLHIKNHESQSTIHKSQKQHQPNILHHTSFKTHVQNQKPTLICLKKSNNKPFKENYSKTQFLHREKESAEK